MLACGSSWSVRGGRPQAPPNNNPPQQILFSWLAPSPLGWGWRAEDKVQL